MTTRWFVVERGAHCWLGGHAIDIGTWAFWSWSKDGTASCAECLDKHYRITKPLTMPPGQFASEL